MPDPEAEQHRHHGQPARPQRRGGAPGDRSRRRELRLLPPYSPGFNPIDNAFAKLKALLRKAAARTVTALERAIAEAIDTITPTECANYFTAAGFDPV